MQKVIIFTVIMVLGGCTQSLESKLTNNMWTTMFGIGGGIYSVMKFKDGKIMMCEGGDNAVWSPRKFYELIDNRIIIYNLKNNNREVTMLVEVLGDGAGMILVMKTTKGKERSRESVVIDSRCSL